jgi:histidyl-tRNA synthetase
MSSDRITPRTLKGFRDFLPSAMMHREQIIDTAKKVYRSFGYAPIDTPALEYLEILTGKGSDETDRQMYRFEDAGGRQVGMRFDLTVPLADIALSTSKSWGRHSSGTTSHRSGEAKTPTEAATESLCNATSIPSALAR